MAGFFALNEGPTDRIIRVIVGLAVLSLVFFGPKTWWGLLGLVPLVTGIIGSCPLYSIVGTTTCPANPTSATHS